MIVNKFPLAAESGHIYGVNWNGNYNSDWTRTDDSADFQNPVPYIGGASSYGSPFDNLYPWKDMTIANGSRAGKVVKIPKFWYKLTPNNNNEKQYGFAIQIADYAADGFSVCPACMDRGDGKGVRSYIYVGRYHCASTYKSTSKVKPAANQTFGTFKTGIEGLGTGIYMMDFATLFTIWLLYLVEFANWKSQYAIGYGNGEDSSSSTVNMGYTDSMPYHTGTMKTARSIKGPSTQYRNIEGLWENVEDFIDGCSSNNVNCNFNIRLNPNASLINVGAAAIGIPYNFSIKNVSGTFPLFIPYNAGGGRLDRWYTNGACITAGSCYNQTETYNGIFELGSEGTTMKYSYIGSRLMQLP